MAFYKYQAYDSEGKKYDDEIEADSEKDALVLLHKNNLFVSTIKLKIQQGNTEFGLLNASTINLKQLGYLTSELGLLLKNGVKIDKGLSILSHNNTTGPINELLTSLLSDIRNGMALSESMQKQENVFTPLYINLVKLGEASGNLPNIFEQLSKDLYFQQELKEKIIQALTYPIIIFTVCLLCILFVFNYIVPQMSGLFAGMTDLPNYTIVLLSLSDWFRKYQFLLLISTPILFIFLYKMRKNSRWQMRYYALAMRLPFIKSIMINAEQIRFNSSLAMMSDAGVALDKAMLLSAQSVRNLNLKQELLSAQQKIRKGAKLSETLSKSPLYPSFSVSLLEVGEESGDLGPVFDELSTRAKSEFQSAIKKVTTILEPLLILVMGGIVGSVVVTMLLSIISVNDIGL